MRKSAAALSLAVLCAVLLAACGSSDSTTTQTVTVPSGKLGAAVQGTPTTPQTSSSTLIYEGTYMGSTEDNQDVRFSYSTDDQLTNFTVGGNRVAATIQVNSASFNTTVGTKTYQGSWQWDTFVAGTIATKGANGKITKVKWEANAYSF